MPTFIVFSLIACRFTKDRERKRVELARKMVECENQWHARVEKSDLVDFIVNSTTIMNPTTTQWRKYCVVVDNLHELLFNPTRNFTNEDRRHALRKFLDKDNVQGLLPQFVKDTSDIKDKLSLLENLKIAYAQLVAQKSKENLSYRNTLLITVVSNEVGPSQRYISRTIGGSRYLLSKAVTYRIHVGLIGDNIWGGLPQKQCSNIVGEIDHELILNFCDTSTTISPNRKDLKWWHIGVKTWEEYSTHYLQET